MTKTKDSDVHAIAERVASDREGTQLERGAQYKSSRQHEASRRTVSVQKIVIGCVELGSY